MLVSTNLKIDYKKETLDFLQNEATNEDYQNIFTKYIAEKKFAESLNMKYINATGFDAINIHGKKFEIKVTTKATYNLTITNIFGKEDILYKVYPGVIDDKYHYFYFPKYEYPYVVKKGQYDWEITEDFTDRQRIVNCSVNGKMSLPKNYQTDKYNTWRKQYLRDKAITFKHLYTLVNNSKPEEKKNNIETIKSYNINIDTSLN